MGLTFYDKLQQMLNLAHDRSRNDIANVWEGFEMG